MFLFFLILSSLDQREDVRRLVSGIRRQVSDPGLEIIGDPLAAYADNDPLNFLILRD